MEEHAAHGAVLRTLLVSELVDAPRWVERLGDKRAGELLLRHDRLARDLLPEDEGQEIDRTQGLLLLFERPINAVRYALAYHRGLVSLSEEVGFDLSAQVGIHLGEVVLIENPPRDVERGAKPVQVEGLAKLTAARLTGMARGRQTLLTRGAFDLARRAAVGERAAEGLRWLAHGRYVFDDVAEPVPVFEVGEAGFAPLSAPADGARARRMVGEETVLGWRPGVGLGIPRRQHWVLERKLEEGGFGEVWLAAHEKTRDRRVFKFCFDAKRLRALQREITLFRLLKEELGERDDIARIFDWNFEEAPYFIESEYTGGGSLIEWAEQQGGIAQVPIETRLEIVAQAAEALGAAHSVGVLHKDVKPGNVLIHTDARGAPRARLADFGIGLVTDPERLAQAGITVMGMTRTEGATEPSSSSGTRLYHAPELMEGKAATVQADVYALGVMLYQMAVGDFFRALAPGWERHVAGEDLREDVAWAVDGSPRRRLGNAARLAERLRSLEQRQSERVTARRVQAAFERSRRRRKAMAAVIAVLALFAGATAFYAYRVRQEVTRANQEARRANREAQTAQRVTKFLVDLFEVSDPGQARGDEVMAREILDRGAAKIPEELADQPLIQARLMVTIGKVYSNLGLFDPAARLFENSLEIRRQYLGDQNPEVAASLNDLANIYWRQGRYEDAEHLLQSALRVREQLLGGVHLQVAVTLHNLAGLYSEQGHYKKAEPLHRRALEILEQAQGREHPFVARALHNLALWYRKQGRYKEAEPLSRQSLAIFETILGAGHPDLIVPLNSLARLYVQLGGRSADSEELFQRALKIAETALEPNHTDRALTLHNLADVYRSQGRYSEAESYARTALEIREKVLGSEHSEVGESLFGLALIFRDQERHPEAESRFRRALEIQENVLEPGHPDLKRTLAEYTALLRAMGREAEAKALAAAYGR